MMLMMMMLMKSVVVFAVLQIITIYDTDYFVIRNCNITIVIIVIIFTAVIMYIYVTISIVDIYSRIIRRSKTILW